MLVEWTIPTRVDLFHISTFFFGGGDKGYTLTHPALDHIKIRSDVIIILD